jgi:hypothetical protein
MSQFSTINSQHSALRDLERQRLERKMGQLRREIDGTDQAGQIRRFKPPGRRRVLPNRCASEVCHHSVRSEDAAGPGADALGVERQSLEMAWLWSASNRMEEDAEKVASFLSKHGLDRFRTLLAEDPNGLGASLDTLVQADEDSLERAGIPASPRRHLLEALREWDLAEAVSDRQRSAVSATTESSRTKAASQLHTNGGHVNEPRWGCLGRAPPGWHPVAANATRSPVAVVQTADAGTACDTRLDTREEELVIDDACTFVPQCAPSPPVGSPPVSRRPTSSFSRPTSAASRPGSSHGTERISCYQCYKQVLPKFAVSVEDTSCSSGLRQFCSEACSESFQTALLARHEREKQLNALRASMLKGDQAEGLADPP